MARLPSDMTGKVVVVTGGNAGIGLGFARGIAIAGGDIVIGGSGRPAPGGRAHIGGGELPLVRMPGDVPDADYTGVSDLEVVPVDFGAGRDEAALRRGIVAASRLLADAGI